jgi:UPF0755 protein
LALWWWLLALPACCWWPLGVGAVAACLVVAGSPAGAGRADGELSIEPGSNPREIAQAWVDAGVQTSPRLLYEWFRWSGQARRIRPAATRSTPAPRRAACWTSWCRANETLEQLRFIEGWTLRQVRAALAKAPHLKPTTAGLSDAQLMEELGAAGHGRRGALLSRHLCLRPWRQRPDGAAARPPRAAAAPGPGLGRPRTRFTAEVGRRGADPGIHRRKGDRPAGRPGLVAGVFVNRLRIGMPLQTDPTVIYGLGEAFDGNLRKRDLQTDTPYNTYTRGGLPPTPIALPGQASLRAAVRPQPPRRCTSWRAATAAASSAKTWPTIIAR